MEDTLNIIKAVFTAIGGYLGYVLGGHDGFLYALIAFIGIDYLTGVMLAIIKKRLSSDIGFEIIDSPTCISHEQWLRIFQYFVIGVSGEKKILVNGSYSRLLKEQKKIEKVNRSRIW